MTRGKERGTSLGTRKSLKISISDRLVDYADAFLDEVLKIQDYLIDQSNLYESFQTYRGEAKKEINEYGEAQLGQIQRLSNYYSYLANTLMEIIMLFYETDKISAEKYCSFMISILEKTGSIEPGQITAEQMMIALNESKGG